MKQIVKFILLSLLLTAVLSACGGGTSLRYRVTGTAKEATILVSDQDGNDIPEQVVQLPYELVVTPGNSFNFKLFATNTSGQGDIKIEVFANEASLCDANGSYFAGCEGSYKKSGGNVETKLTSYDDVPPQSYAPPTPEAPATPQISVGLEGMILFAGYQKEAKLRNFYVLDLSKGGERIQLTEGLNTNASCPSISPDGRTLLFNMVYGDVFTINLDGTALTNISNSGSKDTIDFCASWSPDGSQIIYNMGTKISGNNLIEQIYSAQADGSGISPLTKNNSEDLEFKNPVFSPDGQKIASISGSFNASPYLTNMDGSGTTPLAIDGKLVLDIHWSPDGSKILFACNEGSDNIGSGVCVMNNDLSGLTKLTDDTVSHIWYTAWSPDGTKIAFIAAKDKIDNIFMINADGTGLTQLTNLTDMEPLWVAWYNSIDLSAAPISITINQ